MRQRCCLTSNFEMLNLCNYISLSIDDFNQVKIDRRQSLDILTDWMTFPAQIRIGVGPTYAEDNVGTLKYQVKVEESSSMIFLSQFAPIHKLTE